MSDPAAREALVRRARAPEADALDVFERRRMIAALCDLVEEQARLVAVAPEDSMANAHGLSDRHILTVGELRREMHGLADECTVEVAVGGAGYGDGITAESDNDGEAGWLSIFVRPPTAAAVPGPTREELAKIIYAFASDEPHWWIPCADEILRRFGSALCKETPYGELAISELPCKHGRTACIECGKITTAFSAKETTGLGSRAEATVANQYRQIDLEYAHQVIADLRDDAATERHEAASYRESGHEGRARKHDVQATDYERSAEAIERILAEDVRANILRDLRFHRDLAAECRAHGVGDFRIGRAEGIEGLADDIERRLAASSPCPEEGERP